MKKLIVANWKMHPDSASEAVLLAKQTEKGISKSGNEIVIVPPFPFLPSVKKVLKRAKLGAQDVSHKKRGAYTGEVSPSMLKNSGVEYVIIGHSERRRLGETDEMINKKIKAALKTGLKVILCVGEPYERGLTRTSRGLTRNEKAAKNFVKSQLQKDLKGLLHSTFYILHSRLIIAYEPVWAISTNKNARADKPENALEMIKFIKEILHSKFYILNSRVLYGGSVTSKNARNFLQYKEIDGALVGGASLKAEELKKIVKSAD